MTSKFLLAAISASFLFGAAHGALAADAPKAPKLTQKIQVALAEAQKAGNAKDYPVAMAAIEKAKAVSSPTPYDSLMINRIAMGIHIGLNDMNAAFADAEAASATDPAVIPDDDKAAVYGPAMKLAINLKQPDKAVKYAKLFLAITPPPTGSDLVTATLALYQGGDYPAAISQAQKNIDVATAAGKKTARSDFDVIMASQVKQKDEAGAEKTLETLIANFNAPEDWNQLMTVSLGTKGMRDIDYVYLGRLMLQRGQTISSSDAQLIGNTANKLALYGDAEAMQKVGGPASDAREAADKKSVPAQIAAGAKLNGEYNVKLAEVLYGYGMFPEAIAAAQLSKTKGGAKDTTEADMVIGMAQAASGQYAVAGSAFGGITAPNPASARVVRLWGYFVKLKASPATAAAQ